MEWWWNDGSGRRKYPGGLVISGSPTQEPSPAVNSLSLALSEPRAVIQISPRRRSLAKTTHTVLCLSRPGLESEFSPAESNVMPSKVAPSSPMDSPVCRANAMTSSMLVRRSSNEVAVTVSIPAPCSRSLSWSYHFVLLRCSIPLPKSSVTFSPLHSLSMITGSQFSPVNVRNSFGKPS
jgi:hypothetical protein